MSKIFIKIIFALVLTFFLVNCKDDSPTEPALGTGTFVSTTAQNQNVLLEEYTGVYCSYCPDGHRIADSLAKVHQGKFFHINIHAGSLSAFYTIPEGEQLRQAFSITAYPGGVVNRQKSYVYASMGYGDYFTMRGSWKDYSKEMTAKSAYANIAAKAEIVGRTLTIKVQIYFTDDSKVSNGENYVNIVLLQNNIWGTQSGGDEYYSAMWNDNTQKYRHNNMLRAMITGLNGESIGANTKGTLYEKIFTYDIPQKISNEDVVLKDLVVLAFVTEKTPADANTLPSTQSPVVINVCKSSLSIK